MREIKFRAWYKNKMWYLGEEERQEEHYGNFVDNVNEAFQDKDIVWLQFTGLYDKNGKEIYEGDIYECNGDNYQVMFLGGAFVGGKNEKVCCPLGWDGDEIEPEIFNQATVIGNIYENPKLLSN